MLIFLRFLVPRLRRPKLGQHFLTDPGYRSRIAQSLPLQPDELVIEIGAGRGDMTRLLAGRARKVVAVEIDPALARKLEEKFRGQARVEILHADILSVNIAELCRRAGSDACFVFGNLPYYITSPIIHHLVRYSASIRGMALLVQREVAERLVATPGTRAYGYLSVLTQLTSRTRVVFTVPPGAFSPPPKVHSALVSFEVVSTHPAWAKKAQPPAAGAEARAEPGNHIGVSTSEPRDKVKFLEFVKRCFTHKRKNLLNNLSASFSRNRIEHELAQLSLPPTVRAEQLSIERLADLYAGLDPA